MSISSEITRLSNAKTAISTAIAAKGVTVPAGTALDGMSALINTIDTVTEESSVPSSKTTSIIKVGTTYYLWRD